MNVLILSEAAYSSDLWLRAEAQGHKIKMWIKEPHWREVYDDLIDKVPSWESHVPWADLIIFDHTGMSNIWKKVKDIKPCFGGSEFADKLEHDRSWSNIFEPMKIPDNEGLKFTKIDEAISHLKTHKVKHVVKPEGKEMDSWNVIIGEDKNNEDAIVLLEVLKGSGRSPEYLYVEERKEGIEVGLSGWFITDGKKGDWSGPINVNFEHKRLMAGFPEGVGPLCGEAGTAMRYDSQDNKLFKNTLDKLKPVLIKNNYRGQIDLSFMVMPDGKAFFLEATPRLGYPACMLEETLQKNSFIDLFYAAACGDYKFKNSVSMDWAVGVCLFMPGFPSKTMTDERSVGIPIFGLDKDNNMEHTHLIEAKVGADSRIVTSRGMGNPAVITGTGKTLQEAKANAYRIISNSNPNRVRIPNMFYRTDIGDRVIRQLPKIYDLGILSKEESAEPLLTEAF